MPALGISANFDPTFDLGVKSNDSPIPPIAIIDPDWLRAGTPPPNALLTGGDGRDELQGFYERSSLSGAADGSAYYSRRPQE
jgi:hypothetical protein